LSRAAERPGGATWLCRGCSHRCLYRLSTLLDREVARESPAHTAPSDQSRSNTPSYRQLPALWHIYYGENRGGFLSSRQGGYLSLRAEISGPRIARHLLRYVHSDYLFKSSDIAGFPGGAVLVGPRGCQRERSGRYGTVLRFCTRSSFSQDSSPERPETSRSTAAGGGTLPWARRATWRGWSSCRLL
jgi:hypothetical protein